VEAQVAHEREDFLDAEARTRRELETVRERAAEAQERLRAEVDSARAEADQMRRSDTERKGRGRLRRVWDGWLGR
jgi:hypothetical protein